MMADSMMSPSDVAVMMKDNDGWGNGMGFMWIFALLILANGGFGGWGGNGFANAIGYENLATSNEVQRGFDQQNSMANEGEILEKANNNDNIIFDSNAISPGTKFMFNLTYYIKNYIQEQKKVNEDWMGIEILLTGSDVPGEGEHKILEYIRNYKLSEKYSPYTKHCIYGADADLIMLSLLSHEYNFNRRLF